MIKKTLVKSKSCYKVTFSLPKTVAENASEVKVLGEFNNWEWENGLKMKATKTAFTAEVELETGRDYQFRYLIDNNKWENDWNADNYVSNPFGYDNSVVACPSVEGVPVSKAAKTTAKVATKKTAAKKVTAKKITTSKATTAKKAVAKKVTKKAAPKASTKKVSVAKTAAKKAVAKKAVAKKAAKTVVSADNKVANKMKKKGLQVIEGVGPKIEKLMHEAGLMNFNDVANAPLATLKKVLEDAGSRFRMHDPSTWSKQAKMAHEGKWNELAKWQGELKGGRK